MLDLENRIRENKAFFEDNEPDNGHRERFINKLSESGSKKRKISLSSISKIAASLIILISASYFIVNETRQAKSNVMYITQIELTDEMVQLQSYYDQLSLDKLNSIDSVAGNNTQAAKLKEMAIKKMDKLDANLAIIEKDYMKNPQCEKLKEAIINNKKKKIEVIDNIVEQASNARRGYHVGEMFDKF